MRNTHPTHHTHTGSRPAAKRRRTAGEHLAFVVNELIRAPLYIAKMR